MCQIWGVVGFFKIIIFIGKIFLKKVKKGGTIRKSVGRRLRISHYKTLKIKRKKMKKFWILGEECLLIKRINSVDVEARGIHLRSTGVV